MKVVGVNKGFSRDLASKEAALDLLKDRVIVYPTDTLYGMGVNALNVDAIEKLYRVKKRPNKKPLPIIVGSVEMAKAFAIIDRRKEEIVRQLWPGPFTFVFVKKKLVPDELTAGERTVAMRVPDNSFCENLLADFEGPIVATSANISGEEPLSTAREIAERFSEEKNQPDLIVDAGFLPGKNPSTIIDLTGVVPQVLRVDPTTKDKLLKILKTLSS